MASKIFVNLPVKNLNLSVEFFTKLGFTFNQQFTDETATCMIVTDDIFVMLLTEEKFKSFTPKEICDAKKYRSACLLVSKARQKSIRCRTCGIHPYGEGTDPKGNRMAAINIRCLDGIDLESVPVQHFEGRSS